MIIKCGDQIFDPNIVPCMIVLSEVDKDNIARMLPEATRYAAYPDRMTEGEVESWMDDARISKVYEGPSSAITGGPPCHGPESMVE